MARIRLATLALSAVLAVPGLASQAPSKAVEKTLVLAPDGRLDAMYFNPNPLPFARAQATQEGTTLRVFLELRAGGYGGSTYELTYDAAGDRLVGIYHQAVAKQRYEIHFVRK